MGENIVAIIHMYGATAIVLLIFDHQDTEYEEQEIEMSIYQPIPPPKKDTKVSMGSGYP